MPGDIGRVPSAYTLIMVAQPRLNQNRDFAVISDHIRRTAPDIETAILEDRVYRWLDDSMARPTLVFSPLPLVLLKPPRGAVYQGINLTASQECAALDRIGIPVPRWTRLTPDHTPDLTDFGPYVVVKPDQGFQGADVRIKRKGRVRWSPPKTRTAAGSRDWVVQEFVYTGRWPVSYRVTTLFGHALWAVRWEANHDRQPLESRYAFQGGGMSIVASAKKDAIATPVHDSEIIAFGERAHAAFPEIPLLGVDVLQEQPSGRLYAIEVNAMGLTWLLSSAVGLGVQRTHGFDLDAEFNSLEKAAAILAQETRRRAR